jgi:hypothetical protein
MTTHDIIASFITLAGDTRLAVLGGTEVSPRDLSIENRERSLEDAASASYNAVTESLSQRKRLVRREVR